MTIRGIQTLFLIQLRACARRARSLSLVPHTLAENTEGILPPSLNDRRIESKKSVACSPHTRIQCNIKNQRRMAESSNSHFLFLFFFLFFALCEMRNKQLNGTMCCRRIWWDEMRAFNSHVNFIYSETGNEKWEETRNATKKNKISYYCKRYECIT